MKKAILCVVLCLITATIIAQRGMGTNTPHTSSVLELRSNNKGFLPPRMTLVEINAIPDPAEGLIIYCLDCTEKWPYYYDGNKWVKLGDRNTPQYKLECHGFSSDMIQNVPISNMTLSFTIQQTNADLIPTLNFNASDVVLTGNTTGITVGAPDVSSYTFAGLNDQVTVSYPLTGTPVNTGDLIANINIGTIVSCSSTYTIFDVIATFDSPNINYDIVSSKDAQGNTLTQGEITDDIVLEIPIIKGMGTINAYTSNFSSQILQDNGGNPTKFRISYPATVATNGGTLTVTIRKDTPGTFLVPRSLEETISIMTSFDLIINGDPKATINLRVLGGYQDINFDTNSLWYQEVTAEDGNVWLDRNLGASRVALSDNDQESFGDYYQWGRLPDGHHFQDSEVTTTIANGPSTGHSKFILSSSSTVEYNWTDFTGEDELWQEDMNGTILNNPCPKGFRVPIIGEWNSIYIVVVGDNLFQSKLKLPFAGYRDNFLNRPIIQGSADYWSSTINFADAHKSVFAFSMGINNSAFTDDIKRAKGMPVRCIKR